MLVTEINDLVKAADDNRKIVDLHRHIGGGRYVSVTCGILCVDFRKFFCPAGTDEIKPKRCGVALRLHEWWKFVDIIKSIDDANPALVTALPCYTGDEHLNQLDALQCSECNPFETE